MCDSDNFSQMEVFKFPVKAQYFELEDTLPTQNCMLLFLMLQLVISMCLDFILLSLWVLNRIVTELVETGQQKSVCACVGENFSNNLITMLINFCQNRSGQQVAQFSPFGMFCDGCLSV